MGHTNGQTKVHIFLKCKNTTFAVIFPYRFSNACNLRKFNDLARNISGVDHPIF